jgi:hypothetical protein
LTPPQGNSSGARAWSRHAQKHFIPSTDPQRRTWPPFSAPLGQFDKNQNHKIEAGEYANDPIWKGVFVSIDKKLGDGDKDLAEEEWLKAEKVNGGGLVRTRLGGTGDVSESHVVWRHTKGRETSIG